MVLLNFWVFTCYNCTNTVPSLVDFDRKYRDKGLTIIGIHTPEFPPYAGEHDKGNVQRALKKYGIEYPNAQDNDDKTWNLYGIRFWPSFVLIDKKGTIRYEGARRVSSERRKLPDVGSADPEAVGGVSRRRPAILRTLLLLLGRGPRLPPTPGAPKPRSISPPPIAGPDTRVTLHAGPHLKINARLAPALELAGGDRAALLRSPSHPRLGVLRRAAVGTAGGPPRAGSRHPARQRLRRGRAGVPERDGRAGLKVRK